MPKIVTISVPYEEYEAEINEEFEIGETSAWNEIWHLLESDTEDIKLAITRAFTLAPMGKKAKVLNRILRLRGEAELNLNRALEAHLE